MKSAKSKSGKDLAYHVSGVSIGVNTALSVGKLAAGIVGGSSAMISDAIHSASDVLSTFVVILGIKLSNKKADEDHKYGHERMEPIASFILAMFLFATGLGIGWSGLQAILHSDTIAIQTPGFLALSAALASIVTKEWMYWYTRAAAKKINSGALMADAWHHRSDAFSSIGAFVGILGARMGFPILDPIASLVICLFIAKASYDIFKDATDKLVDKSCGSKMENKIRKTVIQIDGVERVDELKTRLFGCKVYVDVEIAADSRISFKRSHEIAEETEKAIERSFPNVKHCMVHVNPIDVKDQQRCKRFVPNPFGLVTIIHRESI